MFSTTWPSTALFEGSPIANFGSTKTFLRCATLRPIVERLDEHSSNNDGAVLRRGYGNVEGSSTRAEGDSGHDQDRPIDPSSDSPAVVDHGSVCVCQQCCEFTEYGTQIYRMVLLQGDRFVHDVYIGNEGVASIYHGILAVLANYSWAFLALHESSERTHYHFAHLCKWNLVQRACRCSGLRRFTRAGGKRHYVDASFGDLGGQDIQRILEYLRKDPRRLVIQKTPNSVWGNLHVHPARGVGQHQEPANQGMVEGDVAQSPHPGGSQSRKLDDAAAPHDRRPGLPTSPGPKSRKLTVNQIGELVNSMAAIPIRNCILSKRWRFNKDVKFITEEDKIFRRAVIYVESKCIYRSTRDFVDFYKFINPMFRNYGETPDYYLTIEDTLKIVNDMLLFQFNNETEHVREFLQSCYDIIEKIIPKKNCLEIVSPPSSGKNFFIDFMSGFYLNVGNIGNFNRYSNFPFQDCANRRLLIWNEPNVESSALDTCKMLFGGDPLPAKIKFCGDATIPRTPVFVLSNKSVFPNDTAFNDRMYKFKWRQASFLKNVQGYPYPLAWPKLLDMYNIEY
uniref:Non-capsid protein NS-1 n=1 Tax=Lygus hesperus TaxID=30085 RepID=A0A0A9YTR0_LYGHE